MYYFNPLRSWRLSRRPSWGLQANFRKSDNFKGVVLKNSGSDSIYIIMIVCSDSATPIHKVKTKVL